MNALLHLSLRQHLADAVRQLAKIADSPRLEAEWLWAEALSCDRAALLAMDRETPSDALREKAAALLARRLAGEPMAYVLGRRGFWTLDLTVTPDVLIPRPETEGLVEWSLQLVPNDEVARIADLGTGSGAIALAIAAERPQASLVATDASAAALKIAQANSRRLGQTRIEFRLGDWCVPLLSERFELIVSNPPYIEAGDIHLAALCHEPLAALASGTDGLDAIRTICAQAPVHLHAGAWLLLEHGHTQGAAVRALLDEAGFQSIETRRDLAGHERLSGGRWQ